MSFIKPKKIDEYIIFYLSKGPKKCLDLVVFIQKDRPNTTKQAVYAALRQLLSKEQLIITKGIASLNISWINEITSFLNKTQSSYKNFTGQGSFLNLEENERIKYYFQTMHKADLFWTHAFYLLFEQLQENEPVYLYNPHEWFLYARNKNELEVINLVAKSGHPFLLTAGYNTFLDKYAAKYFDQTNSQYWMFSKPMFKENNYYVNIFGDFLIEVWLDKNIANEIEKLYETHNKWNEGVEKLFENILTIDGRMKLIISRNHKKAEKFKKSFSKGFAIKK